MKLLLQHLYYWHSLVFPKRRFQCREGTRKRSYQRIQGDTTMLYMVNNSQEVGPGRSSKLLEYDTSTSKYRGYGQIADWMTFRVWKLLVRWQLLCYYYWCAISFGLVKVNIRTGADYLDCKNFYFIKSNAIQMVTITHLLARLVNLLLLQRFPSNGMTPLRKQPKLLTSHVEWLVGIRY